MEKFYKKRPKPFNSILENGDRCDHFQELNIERPQSLSPMQMELGIQADRVIFALNKNISILNVMANLPLLLDNGAELIKKLFTEHEANFIFFVVKKYDEKHLEKRPTVDATGYGNILDSILKIKKNRINTQSIIMSKKEKNLPTAVEIIDPEVDPCLSQVIDFIFSNKCVRQTIDQSQPNDLVIPSIIYLIKKLQELTEVAKLKLYFTGDEEAARDKQLRHAYKSNVMLTAAINDLKQQLELQRKQLGEELNKKVSTFDGYNKRITKIKEDFQITIEKTIHDSEKRMMHQCIESEGKQAELSVLAQNFTEEYEKLLSDHMADEKVLRAKRLKTETQLHTWINKYDQDIGDKQAEYDELKLQFDTEKEQMDNLEDLMDEQQQEYTVLMEEKREEEERIYQEMAYQFLIQRSARKIQRYWRAYRERRARRKGKKGKKGKDSKKSTGKK